MMNKIETKIITEQAKQHIESHQTLYSYNIVETVHWTCDLVMAS